jgi:hypothetical protein
MKKLVKMLAAGALIASVATTMSFADYNKGFKYFNKYVKKSSGVTSTAFLKKIDIEDPDDLDALFANNAKGLIEAANKAGLPKVAKGLEKIVKKHKTKDVEDFLKGILNGKVPAGC